MERKKLFGCRENVNYYPQRNCLYQGSHQINIHSGAKETAIENNDSLKIVQRSINHNESFFPSHQHTIIILFIIIFIRSENKCEYKSKTIFSKMYTYTIFNDATRKLSRRIGTEVKIIKKNANGYIHQPMWSGVIYSRLFD